MSDKVNIGKPEDAMASPTVAPFPYFGGKRAAVERVWKLFGKVDNYVEPFCGSAAMLLGAPEGDRIETVNDVSGFVVNFWRAVKSDPEAVAHWADWPVSEIDLEARHGWLVNRKERLRWSLEDPDFYDAKIAGWWVWGANAWIGTGWCLGEGPHVSNGANIQDSREIAVKTNGLGINRQVPHLGDAGRGINRKLPDGTRLDFILDWFTSLANRLRDVRITCGDWSRVVTPIATHRHGITAVFLDPPYADVSDGMYEQEHKLTEAIAAWCIENQDNPKMRIVLCGYSGEYDLPGWRTSEGRATNGGYARENNQSHLETIWASPHCLAPDAELDLWSQTQ